MKPPPNPPPRVVSPRHEGPEPLAPAWIAALVVTSIAAGAVSAYALGWCISISTLERAPRASSRELVECPERTRCVCVAEPVRFAR